MTYATTDDVVAELGRPASSTAETEKWQAWLDRVERAIVRRFTRAGLVLADEITAGTLTADDVRDVEVSAVLRKIANPNGYTSVTRTIDDAQVTTRREGTDDAGDPLAVTDAEWAILLPAGAPSAAFSTRPGFEPDTPPADYSWT